MRMIAQTTIHIDLVTRTIIDVLSPSVYAFLYIKAVLQGGITRDIPSSISEIHTYRRHWLARRDMTLDGCP